MSARQTLSGNRAVIDIGSNTVRLVVVGGPPRAPVVLHNEKVTARLGRGMAETGLLSAKAMQQALAALARFAALIAARGVEEVHAVATAAVRDAANGDDFLAQVRALGLHPRLLSGAEEARASAMGVIAAFPGAEGTVADLGGGSLELVRIGSGDAANGVTLPLGSLRLPALREKGHARFARRVRRLIEQSGWQAGETGTLYLVGGSHRALARHAMRREGWPLDDPHGHALAPRAMLAETRAARRETAPAPIPGVSAARLASLPDTAALVDVLVRELAPSRVVFSSWGLREGLLHAALPPEVQAQDPLLAGIAAFSASLGVVPAEAERLSEWVRATLPAADARLLPAAAHLALAAQTVEPNLRGAEAQGWALAKRWIGLDAEGRAILAAMLAGNMGERAVPPGLERLALPAHLAAALAAGQALRLGRRLGGGRPLADGAAKLAAGAGWLVLTLDKPWRALAGEAVEKDLRLLAATLGLDFRIRA